MTDYPITPPPELVQQWASESLATQNLCNRAAQWGANQELEATLAEVSFLNSSALADRVRSKRRPKPLPLELDPQGKPLEEQRCDNCRYRVLRRYREMTQEISYFACHRNAPQPSERQHASAFWPIVDDDDWCGEWRSLETQDWP